MLEPTTDPGEVGVDADRLARIDALTHGYVDDGRFPGVRLPAREDRRERFCTDYLYFGGETVMMDS